MLTISYTQERHPHPQKLGLQPQHLGLGIVTLTGCHSNTPKLNPQPVAKSLYVFLTHRSISRLSRLDQYGHKVFGPKDKVNKDGT